MPVKEIWFTSPDYVGPVTPARETPTITVTPSAPRPIRRTETPVEGLLQVRRTLRFSDPTIQLLTSEEANSFGVPPIPEVGSDEDRSMTEETFGVDDVHDAQAATALNTPRRRQPSSSTMRASPRRGVRR